MFLTGFGSRIDAIASGNVLALIFWYLGALVLVATLALAAQIAFHNRVWIEKLSTGPASVSLVNKTNTYFDEYLDEIVYFFEATDVDIAIFEDLDRFNDPFIFETLRELNVILNNSKQLKKQARPVHLRNPRQHFR